MAQRACVLLARLLLCLSLMVLSVSLLTEGKLGLDNFPRGGQDLELTIFLALVLVCMALLAALIAKQLMDGFFGNRQCEYDPKPRACIRCQQWATPALCAVLLLEQCRLPLRI